MLDGGEPWLVLGDELLRWSPSGYAERRPRRGGEASVITPPTLVECSAPAGRAPCRSCILRRELARRVRAADRPRLHASASRRRSSRSSRPRSRRASRSSTPPARTGTASGCSLRRCGARAERDRARIVTKGGMARPDGAWVPDGRAKAIRADCEASLAALDGLPIDLYLVHAPDPRTPWQTTVRALARLVDEGSYGASASRTSTAGSWTRRSSWRRSQPSRSRSRRSTTRALRGGVLERCDELGLALLAHSPLGGPKRARRVDAAETLAWLLGLSPVVVADPRNEPAGSTCARTRRSRGPAAPPRRRAGRRRSRATPTSSS